MIKVPQIEPTSQVEVANLTTAIIAHERQKSLMLRAWILSGLFFMALPGTLLGFSNLMAISTHHGLSLATIPLMAGNNFQAFSEK